jgi:hypothetical protein
VDGRWKVRNVPVRARESRQRARGVREEAGRVGR